MSPIKIEHLEPVLVTLLISVTELFKRGKAYFDSLFQKISVLHGGEGMEV